MVQESQWYTGGAGQVDDKMLQWWCMTVLHRLGARWRIAGAQQSCAIVHCVHNDRLLCTTIKNSFLIWGGIRISYPSDQICGHARKIILVRAVVDCDVWWLWCIGSRACDGIVNSSTNLCTQSLAPQRHTQRQSTKADQTSGTQHQLYYTITSQPLCYQVHHSPICQKTAQLSSPASLLEYQKCCKNAEANYFRQ